MTFLHRFKKKLTEWFKPKKPEITFEFLQEHIGQDEIDELENLKNMNIEVGFAILVFLSVAFQLFNLPGFLNRGLYFIIAF